MSLPRGGTSWLWLENDGVRGIRSKARRAVEQAPLICPSLAGPVPPLFSRAADEQGCTLQATRIPFQAPSISGFHDAYQDLPELRSLQGY